MHGRVKVRTSEEEKLRKEKERQEKLKAYKHAMQKIQHKRKQGEFDKELMELTGKVLSSNPDIYTLWNIRRETLLLLGSTEIEEDVSKLYDAELQLTEYCLKINPKSYCAWHQREWVLTTRKDPDWKNELSLCEKYLKFDERNFHTWDYRRFIVSQCKPALEEEFKFTTEKLYDNFSNYSAWHYRSKILMELHPGVEGGRSIEGSHHKRELEIVQSAAFTDPDDTSAWFYQRWLLGAVKQTIKLIACTVSPTKTTIAFSDYVRQDFLKSKVSVYFNDQVVSGDWLSATGHLYDVLWNLQHKETVTDDLDIMVTYENEYGKIIKIPCIKNKSLYIGRGEVDFRRKFSEPVIEELKKQLGACRELLTLEPDSKWTLLTTAVFLHCIDAEQYQMEALRYLRELENIDSLRAGYYRDLVTKWSVEQQLVQDYQTDKPNLTIEFTDKITSLPHLQYYSFCENVDLSNQDLSSKMLTSLVLLQHCKKLSLENNKLTTLKGFPDLDLEELNLKGNKDLHHNEVEQLRYKCKYNVIFS